MKEEEEKKKKTLFNETEKMDRRNFFVHSAKMVIPTLGILGLSLELPKIAEAACPDTCSGGCSNTCSGCFGCTGSCAGECSKTCRDICANSCTVTSR
ncbi:MAG: Cys-Xaa-Xaa-Xaa repeat radical SAM target protein [Negativicutes bacterium]|nr:Cys-Xaa-Xaa-Xaa repeat radical SAM target protein [Negativicutes bacterium]